VVRLTGWVAHKRGAAIALAVGLAAVVLVAMVEAAVIAAPVSFLHVRSNLSQTETLVSAYPDLAVSPDENWVVVVWTEGYDDRADFRGHVYLRAASETGGGWGNKIVVFSGDSSAYAYDAAVAVAGDMAHVAYAVFQFDGGSLARTEVRYGTCSLTSGQCGDLQIVSFDDTYLISQVDLALDEDEDPHIVWTRQAEDRSEGDVYYNARAAGKWGQEKWVDESSDIIDGKPAIAWADGYAHVVWQAKRVVGENESYYIRYRRRGGELGSWDDVVFLVEGESSFPPASPDVAAGAGRVFVVWDWCADFDRDIRGYCKKYNLVYWRSDWGITQRREVGTDNEAPVAIYYSAESQDFFPDRSEYLLNLEPSVSLNKDGWPAVIWHADRSEGQGTDYAIHYTYALTGTEDNGVDWITPTVLSQGQPTMLGSGVIGVGKPEPGGEQPPHVAYMQKLSTGAWEVYYDSSEQERDRYAHLYLPLTMRAD
jgi:hypothetical protein